MILLLSNLSSLTQLYTLTMDVHSRLRTDAHQTVTGTRARGGGLAAVLGDASASFVPFLTDGSCVHKQRLTCNTSQVVMVSFVVCHIPHTTYHIPYVV